VAAGDIEAGDKVYLYSGEGREVKEVRFEYLDSPIKVYNFEVEDWHTYFVSEQDVFVHNACEKKLSDDYILGNNRKDSNMLINEYDNIKLGNGTPRIDPETGTQKYFKHMKLNSVQEAAEIYGKVRLNGMYRDLTIS
ncbi:MAG TPA: polymorphic toxin-type HINT domain-containing protein, partial [Acetivibrio sp.]|nr:polymorphic toxin-type HINT domain-containing protein [Acetivibrio sp.]